MKPVFLLQAPGVVAADTINISRANLITMIDVYATIDAMINTETKCRTNAETIYQIFDAIGFALDHGQTLTSLIDVNAYGLMRSYVPQFPVYIESLGETLNNALTVVAIWENCKTENKPEEAANAERTIEAFKKEFNDTANEFNTLASSINMNAETVKNRLKELGYLQY